MKAIPYEILAMHEGKKAKYVKNGKEFEGTIRKDGSWIRVGDCSLCCTDDWGWRDPECLRSISNIELLDRTLDQVMEGDLIQDEYPSSTSKVIARHGEYILRSREHEFNTSREMNYDTIENYKKHGWKIVQETTSEPLTELTLPEVAEKLGIPVERLRIKD